MRKIVLTMSVSLDGFIEGPAREIDWHLVDDELHQHFNDEARAMGGFLHGRVMYELMADFWPTADADPADTGPVAEFAGIWRDKPKYVYSRTLERADWNSTIVRDVVPEEVAALKAAPGGDLGLGGADLTAAFLRHDLVDATGSTCTRCGSGAASRCSRRSTAAGYRCGRRAPARSATASCSCATAARRPCVRRDLTAPV